MMPDLGKYAFEVWLAYGLTLGCLALLIWQSFRQSRRIKSELRDEENLRERNA